MDRAAIDLTPLAGTVERWSATDAIRWAVDTFHPHAAFASSFSAEDVVVTDLLLGVRADARIFTLDTGRLFPEIVESGPLTDLFAIYWRVARRLVGLFELVDRIDSREHEDILA